MSSLLISVRELADLLGLSKNTVYAAAGRGEIPCRRVGRRILFSRAAIMRWLEMQDGEMLGKK